MNRSTLMRRVFLSLAVFLAALSLIGLYGCGKEPVAEETAEEENHEREIPLRTLVQGSICEYGRFEQPATGGETGPAFLVLEDEEGLKRLLSLANLELPEGGVDFSSQVVIAAMQGPRNTSGYAISVVRAVQSGTDVRVEVEMVEPEPGSLTAQVLTSPYHLVLAEREDFLPRGELSFIFMDMDGETLERTAAEI
ncbi:MAG: protease complex subunit PrcB family protein [Actinobacteria bacterium]|nr:protease complex subunit PrcB family protein [Actinomycetota bacterium]